MTNYIPDGPIYQTRITLLLRLSHCFLVSVKGIWRSNVRRLCIAEKKKTFYINRIKDTQPSFGFIEMDIIGGLIAVDFPNQ
jgi:hypothetical protein